ncbi:hypothetical protein CN918_26265 [Priestia megaterium]|nr:hypothetical protein CN918_26265 [Priestia megaterium]
MKGNLYRVAIEVETSSMQGIDFVEDVQKITRKESLYQYIVEQMSQETHRQQTIDISEEPHRYGYQRYIHNRSEIETTKKELIAMLQKKLEREKEKMNQMLQTISSKKNKG